MMIGWRSAREGLELLDQRPDPGVRVLELALPALALGQRRDLVGGERAAVGVEDVGRVGEEDVAEDELRARLVDHVVERRELVDAVVEVLLVVGRQDRREVQPLGQRRPGARAVQLLEEVRRAVPVVVHVRRGVEVGGVVPRPDVDVAIAERLELAGDGRAQEQVVEGAEAAALGVERR